MSTELAQRYDHDDLPSTEIAEGITNALEGLRAIRTFVKQQFKEGVDFGIIPGCGPKPTLFLPGAQKAMMYFNSRPKRTIERVDLGGGHVEYIITTKIVSRATKEYIGEGLGCCSTMESKYRYRKAERVCPKCGQPAIINGKAEYGGGYVCFHKKGGCGAKFGKGDRSIEGQPQGNSENPDLYDVHNTVLKMGKKRADVDAAMTLGCLSELFTQDIEDTYPMVEVREAARQEQEYIDGEMVIDGEVVGPAPPKPKGLFTKDHIARTREFMDWMKAQCDRANEKWKRAWEDKAEGWMGEGLDVPSDFPELINSFKARAHMLKWAKDARRIDTAILPEDLKPAQCEAYLALVFHDEEHQPAFIAELRDYLNRLRRLEADAVYRKHPDLAPEGWSAEQEEAARAAREPDRGDAFEEPEPAMAKGGA
jgi:hypothetical protein